MSDTQADKQAENSTYVGLVGAFTGLLAGFSALKGQREAVTELSAMDLTLLGLATYRAGRLIAYDKVTEPLRAPFTETKPDDWNAGDVVEAKGSGVQKAIGELISCPTCIGTWVGAGLVYGLGVAPGPTRVLMTVLSVAGLGEVINTSVEALNWISQAARKQAGK